MSSLRIHPLHLGTITRQVSNFLYRREMGKVIDVPLTGWYIEGSDKRVLVDTGGIAPEKADPGCFPYKREKDQCIENALGRLGVRCEDIDTIVITHFHWDHCSGMGLFPNARIIVQKDELESALSPYPVFASSSLKKTVESFNYTVISGDHDIAQGVRTILTPGHSDGLQGVLVEAETRTIFIAGDTIPLFRNLEQDPPLISGTYVDLRRYYETFKKIAKLSAFALPGHDFKVFEKTIYC